MKAVAAFFMALLLAAPSNSRPNYGGMPPAKYWGESISVTIYANDVTKFCTTKPPEGYVVKACAFRTENGTPVTVLPNPCFYGAAGEKFATLACHENAHLADWAADHPR